MSGAITLNGVRVVSGPITIPYYGTWVADIVLSDAGVISPDVNLVISDLSLNGTVVRQASFAASRSARIVGGKNGWPNILPSRGYSHAAGVKLSTVLGDAARECGESILVFADRSIGAHYARDAGKAERVLELELDGKWWIDTSGITRTDGRDSSPIVTPFTVIAWSGGKGQFEIASESVASWQPGRTFTAPTVDGIQVISSVTIDVDNDGKLRLHVLSTNGARERLRESIRAIIRQEIGMLSYLGAWEYTIASGDSDTVDVVSDDARMPSLTKVPMMPGLMGEVVTPTPGSKCRIVFVNADPTRPECVGIVGTPMKIEIAGPIPTQAVARFGDAVSGVAITSGSMKVFIGG